MLLGIFLISITLRSPITNVGPLLALMREQLKLSATQAGMLTTLPLLAFAFFSPLASKLALKSGLEQALMYSLILVFSGITVRSLGSSTTLFMGTLIIGVGIAIANVLLPSLIKRDFPSKAVTITAAYVLSMGIGSTISASLAIPMSHVADNLAITLIPSWAFALGSIIIFPIMAILVWLPQLRNHTYPASNVAKSAGYRHLLRSMQAWQMSLFLALNSFLMYIFISWFPTILIDTGYSHEQAGVINSLLQLFTAVPAIILIPFMAKINDKRLLSLTLTILVFMSIIGIMLAPSFAALWAMMFGFGCGGGFILALALISIRTADTHQAATLSGMAQCISYLLAAMGPVIMGAIHEKMGSWILPLTICAAINLIWCVLSLLATKDELVVSS